MSSLDNFALEYRRGVDDTIMEILTIVKNSEYPEDLEMNISEWLKDKGAENVY